MKLLEFILLVLLPLLVLFILIIGIFLTGRQQRQRTKEHDQNFRARYGTRLNKQLEDKKRVWAMFGLTYTGEDQVEDVGNNGRRPRDEESPPPPNYAEALKTQAYKVCQYGTMVPRSQAGEEVKVGIGSSYLPRKKKHVLAELKADIADTDTFTCADMENSRLVYRR